MLLYRIVFLVSIFLLSGCALRPLYGEEGGHVGHKMHHVYVAHIPDRSGQILRNRLQQILTPTGVKDPEYKLKIKLSVMRQEMAFLKDGTASRLQVQLRANYILENYKDAQKIADGELLAVADYNIVLDGDYATVIAEEDALSRAIHDIAWDMKMNLANYFMDAAT